MTAASATSRSRRAWTRAPRCGPATSSASASTATAGVRCSPPAARTPGSTGSSTPSARAATPDSPVGRLSGGEQQRLRVAQSIVGDPALLLADEPLLSLDLHHAAAVSALFHESRTRTGAAVLFVTHDVNPVLPYADRVLYLADGRFRIGTPEQVMTSATLSELYGSPVEVLRSNGRLLVTGGAAPSEHPHSHDHREAS